MSAADVEGSLAGRPPKASKAARADIEAWGELWRSIPTRKQMAKKHGLSEATVDRISRGHQYKTESKNDIAAIADVFCKQSMQNPVPRETTFSNQNSGQV